LLANEEWVLNNQLTEFPGEYIDMDEAEINAGLVAFDDKKAYRIAVYNAFRMVRRLVATHGQDSALETILSMAHGAGPKEAFETVYGQPYDELVASALSYQEDR
jgi:hypothetical protein